MADISVDYTTWSTTESSNPPAGTTVVGTGLDDNLRAIQTGVANLYADMTANGIPDLFLDAGGVINWNAGAATITESSKRLLFKPNGTGVSQIALQAVNSDGSGQMAVDFIASDTTALGSIGTVSVTGNPIIYSSPTAHSFNTGAGTYGGGDRQFYISHTASAVNYLTVTGGPDPQTTSPLLMPAGSSTNIQIWYSTKGSASHTFYTYSSGDIVFQMTDGTAGASGAVNFIRVLNALTTVEPYILFTSTSDTNVGGKYVTSGTGTHYFATGGSVSNIQLAVVHVANAVNYIQVYGNATGSPPVVRATGSDTNIPLVLGSQGTGDIRLYTNNGSTPQLRVLNTTSAVNYWQFTGGATGSPGVITCTAAGSDSNISQKFVTKGTGQVHITATGLNTNGTLLVENSNGTSAEGINIDFSGASPDDNTVWFLLAQDSTFTRMVCYSDGDFANHDGTYGTLSDPEIKTAMIPAKSQWEDVKALSNSMINYETKFSKGKKLLGVNAEIVQSISPGLVRESNWGKHGQLRIVDTMTMLQKGFKALGEAMERIERIEAKLR